MGPPGQQVQQGGREHGARLAVLGLSCGLDRTASTSAYSAPFSGSCQKQHSFGPRVSCPAQKAVTCWNVQRRWMREQRLWVPLLSSLVSVHQLIFLLCRLCWVVFWVWGPWAGRVSVLGSVLLFLPRLPHLTQQIVCSHCVVHCVESSALGVRAAGTSSVLLCWRRRLGKVRTQCGQVRSGQVEVYVCFEGQLGAHLKLEV